MCLDAKAPHLSSTLPPTFPWKFNKHVQPNKGLTRQGNGNSEELVVSLLLFDMTIELQNRR
ncbi:unnamed protein product [Brassica napus]|nr:unnamed protein product [Brassica napus]